MEHTHGNNVSRIKRRLSIVSSTLNLMRILFYLVWYIAIGSWYSYKHGVPEYVTQYATTPAFIEAKQLPMVLLYTHMHIWR